MSRFVKLLTWAEAEFGADSPSLEVLQRWARQGRFSPPAEKRGCCYYVATDAKYVPIVTDRTGRKRVRLADRITSTTKMRAPRPSGGPL